MGPRRRRNSRAAFASLAVLSLLLVGLVQPVAAAPRPDPRIVGGEPADFGEYPFMVALLFEPIAGNDFQKQYCGASLIDSRWVLTAAHCVDFLAGSGRGRGCGQPHAPEQHRGPAPRRQGDLHPPRLEPGHLLPGRRVDRACSARHRHHADPSRSVPADDVFETPGTLLTVIGWGNTRRPNEQG